ncbi:Aspartate-semialdehyde dehydrogenase [Galdieria sulphuraria]|nr:Aspartate-semialdehyde dehydrogenase [Galdieria sulphuraria]
MSLAFTNSCTLTRPRSFGQKEACKKLNISNNTSLLATPNSFVNGMRVCVDIRWIGTAVAVLGCTGSVGQRFIQLLEDHPWFEVVAIGASSRSAGQKYSQACRWKQSTPLPNYVKNMEIRECKASQFPDVDIVFSGLSNEVAGDIEEEFAAAGKAVFSNAKNHRMDPDVPILIPAVNANHIGLIDYQRQRRGWDKGFIVTNANCSTTAMCLGLKPILDRFGIEALIVTTMQAISGAGYPGLPSMDIIDNVVPFIGGEEPKMESESLKIFGQLEMEKIVPASIQVSAMCNRVHVLDGHTECVSLKLKTRATPDEVIHSIDHFPSFTRSLKLPSSPERDVVYTDWIDRPQPRLDRHTGNGFTVTVGRVRECSVLDIKLVLFGHNTVVGAAGGSVINAELCVSKGIIAQKAKESAYAVSHK